MIDDQMIELISNTYNETFYDNSHRRRCERAFDSLKPHLKQYADEEAESENKELRKAAEHWHSMYDGQSIELMRVEQENARLKERIKELKSKIIGWSNTIKERTGG